MLVWSPNKALSKEVKQINTVRIVIFVCSDAFKVINFGAHVTWVKPLYSYSPYCGVVTWAFSVMNLLTKISLIFMTVKSRPYQIIYHFMLVSPLLPNVGYHINSSFRCWKIDMISQVLKYENLEAQWCQITSEWRHCQTLVKLANKTRQIIYHSEALIVLSKNNVNFHWIWQNCVKSYWHSKEILAHFTIASHWCGQINWLCQLLKFATFK